MIYFSSRKASQLAIFFFFAILFLNGCSKDNNITGSIITTPPLDSSNTITKFSFNLPGGPFDSYINDVDTTIKDTLPPGTLLTNLAPDIVSNGGSIEPGSGVAQDFTNPVIYKVTATNGNIRRYKVTITVEKRKGKQVKTFAFNNFTPPTVATVDTILRTIKFALPPAADPAVQTPTITLSDGATVSPASGVPQNFLSPVAYLVKAEDGSANFYTTELMRPAPSAKDVPTPPKYLCIYYGYPSLVNGSGGVTATAVNYFKNYDIIVFAEALLATSHPDHTKTMTIISNLKMQKPSIKIFGYIDLGVSTSNYTEVQLKQKIDAWKAMGATGVFGDDYGYDYGVTRNRQNTFVDYAHAQGMSVFANSWNPDDAMGGVDCHLSGTYGDYYLLESFLVGHGSYRSLDEFKQKGDKAYYYMRTKQMGIATVATVATSQISSTSYNTDMYRQSWHGTAMYNFDAFQFTDLNYSANSSVFYYTNPVVNYGTSWQQYDWIKKVSDTRYERATSSNLLYVSGDGATTGTGGH